MNQLHAAKCNVVQLGVWPKREYVCSAASSVGVRDQGWQCDILETLSGLRVVYKYSGVAKTLSKTPSKSCINTVVLQKAGAEPRIGMKPNVQASHSSSSNAPHGTRRRPNGQVTDPAVGPRGRLIHLESPDSGS